MPENRLMYIAIVFIVSAASIWVGAELSRRIEWTVPYIGGAGVFFLLAASAHCALVQTSWGWHLRNIAIFLSNLTMAAG